MAQTVEDIVKGNNKDSIEDPSQEKDSEKLKTDSEDSEDLSSEKDDEQDEEKERALSVYRKLRGPKGSEFLSQLAKQAGLEIADKDDTKEVKVESATDIIKSELGENYSFLSDQLGRAVEKIINQNVLPKIKESSNQSLETSVKSAVKDIFDEENVPKSLRQELIETMDEVSIEMPFSKNGNLDKYLKRLYNIALKENTKVQVRLDKAKINEEEADNVSSSSDLSSFSVRKGPAKPTLRDAVAAAGRGELWEPNK